MRGQKAQPAVRLFHPGDKPSVLWILQTAVASQATLAAWLGLPSNTGYVDWGGAKAIHAIRSRPGDCYVAEVNGRVVGFMRVQAIERWLFLKTGQILEQYLVVEEIDVAVDMRGIGVGTALLTKSEAIARERACAVIGVAYLANNIATAGLNRKRGFDLKISDVLKGQTDPDEQATVRRFKFIG